MDEKQETPVPEDFAGPAPDTRNRKAKRRDAALARKIAPDVNAACLAKARALKEQGVKPDASGEYQVEHKGRRYRVRLTEPPIS